MKKFLYAIFASCAVAIAAPSTAAPSGWKTVKTKGGECQISVPADWNTTSVVGIEATAPDNSAAIHVGKAKTPFEKQRKMGRMMFQNGKTFSDTDKLVWFEYPQNDPDLLWVVMVPRTTGSCNATVTLRNGKHQDIAKQIIETLSPASPK